MIKINEKIPALSFDVYHNNKIKKMSTADFKGKWLVLFFYPADFTFVCPTELGELADMHAQFKKEGVEIVSVSTDTAFTHLAWHSESPTIGKIKYPMAADPTGVLAKTFGTYIEEEGLALRGTFIINPKQQLVAMEINNNDIGRNASELLRKIQAAKLVAEHKGQVCPASWQPGDKTLKPGEKLVGKI